MQNVWWSLHILIKAHSVRKSGLDAYIHIVVVNKSEILHWISSVPRWWERVLISSWYTKRTVSHFYALPRHPFNTAPDKHPYDKYT